MASVIQPPTAAQLAKICANDQKLILDFIQLFKVQGLFPGVIIYSGALPVGGLLQANGRAVALPANGAAIARSAYPDLFNAIVQASTVTISIATPGVVTWNNHGLAANAQIVFTTTGALPVGLTVNTTYYVKSPTTNTFNVSATAGGTAITTSGTQSGIHRATAFPFGNGNGTTTFNVPTVAAVGGCSAYVIF